METVNFRSITPLRNFIITPDSKEFSHKGKFKDVDYNSKIKKFDSVYREELSEYADEKFREILNFNFGESVWKGVDYVLVVDSSAYVSMKPTSGVEIDDLHKNKNITVLWF